MAQRRRIPSYRLHKASGQAIVTIDGTMHYLGGFGSDESKREYDKLISEWLSKAATKPRDLTVSQVTVHFWRYAKRRYGKAGKGPYGGAVNWRPLLRMLRQQFGRRAVSDFGPKALRSLVPLMIEMGWSRKYINMNLHRAKQIFSWAASEELISHEVHLRLQSVKGIRYGETAARETDPIPPVSDELVDATLPSLPKTVADMVRFQRLTGCRPAEVCTLTPGGIDKSSEVWIYRPWNHKTKRHEKKRTVYIGPHAQRILAPYLLKAHDAYCFRSKRSPRYSTDSYRRAIHRACERQQLEKWSPNQLRHTAGTVVRAEFGAEHAQAILGHSNLSTTEIYAERSAARAIEAAKRLG